jgi:hypothetical protein
VAALEEDLLSARDADAAAVALSVPLLASLANQLDGGATVAASAAERTRFELRRQSGMLLSSSGAEDLIRINPWLPPARANALLELCALTMLRANRVSGCCRGAPATRWRCGAGLRSSWRAATPIGARRRPRRARSFRRRPRRSRRSS